MQNASMSLKFDYQMLQLNLWTGVKIWTKLQFKIWTKKSLFFSLNTCQAKSGVISNFLYQQGGESSPQKLLRMMWNTFWFWNFWDLLISWGSSGVYEKVNKQPYNQPTIQTLYWDGATKKFWRAWYWSKSIVTNVSREATMKVIPKPLSTSSASHYVKSSCMVVESHSSHSLKYLRWQKMPHSIYMSMDTNLQRVSMLKSDLCVCVNLVLKEDRGWKDSD